MNRTLKWSGVLVSLAAMVLLSACGNRGGVDSKDGTQSLAPDQVRTGSASTLSPGADGRAVDESLSPLSPLDLEPASALARRDVVVQYDRLIAECANSAGVSYTRAVIPSNEDYQLASSLRRSREVFRDRDLIIKYLYHWPSDPVVGFDPRLDDPANKELRNCALTSYDTLAVDDTLDGYPSFLIEAASQEQMEVSQALEPDRVKWAGCMLAAGYPSAVMTVPPAHWGTPTEVSADLALADSACRDQVGYTDRRIQLLEDWTAQYALRDATRIEEWGVQRASQSEAVARTSANA